jgi:formate-dependent nitrite reductase membrane component NrfD
MLKMLLSILVLLTAVPVGLLIAWLAKEELKPGKKWFRIIVLGSVLGLIAGFCLRQYILAWTFAYMAILAGISLIKAK